MCLCVPPSAWLWLWELRSPPNVLFSSIHAEKLDQTSLSSDFQGQLALYVITHFSNWWYGVMCLFSITVFFVCPFFLSFANIIGTWEKKFLDLKVNMGSKSFSCYRVSSSVCCRLGGGPGHSGRHQVSWSQNGGQGFLWTQAFTHLLFLMLLSFGEVAWNLLCAMVDSNALPRGCLASRSENRMARRVDSDAELCIYVNKLKTYDDQNRSISIILNIPQSNSEFAFSCLCVWCQGLNPWPCTF